MIKYVFQEITMIKIKVTMGNHFIYDLVKKFILSLLVFEKHIQSGPPNI